MGLPFAVLEKIIFNIPVLGNENLLFEENELVMIHAVIPAANKQRFAFQISISSA